jgi:hypothetical protein
VRPNRFPLPAWGAAIYAAIRGLSLAVAAFLLPRGHIARLHYSLWHLIVSWDSGRYTKIAAHGYSYIPGNLRHDSLYAWFPGYPGVIDALAWIPGLGYARAGLCVTIAAGLAAAWGLTRLGLTLTGDARVSLLLTALWAAAPASVVLSIVYPEALFCALAVWCLVALLERRWLTAGLLAAVAGTVHNTAMALVAAIAVAAVPEVVRALRDGTSWWRPLVAVLLAPLGLLGYWGYAGLAMHRLDGWFWVEKNAHNGFDWGRSTADTLGDAVLHGCSKAVALTLLVVIAAVVLTGCVLVSRLRVFLKVYTAFVVVTAIATGPYYFGSKPRFLLPAMLLALPLARLLAPARTWLLVPLIAVLTAATTWCALYLMSIGWAPLPRSSTRWMWQRPAPANLANPPDQPDDMPKWKG